MNYTSIEAVFSRLTIPKDQFDEDEIIEWVMQGLEMANIRHAYEQDTVVVNINNHKGRLPTGLVQIEMVAYPIETNDCDDCNNQSSEELTDAEIDYINKQHVDRIDEQGIINNYNLFIRSKSFDSQNFKIMRLTNKPMSGKFHCKDCPNLSSNCDLEYTINPNGTITTSFNTGKVCIAYLRHAQNEQGQFLIPEQEDLIQGLAAFAMSKHWEQRMNMKEENGIRFYELYMDRAQNLLSKARGIFITRGFNYKDYKNIVYKNIKWANSYSIFNTGVSKFSRRWTVTN
jgi:hypothetical protein